MRLHDLEPAFSIILSFSPSGDYCDGLARVARIVGRSTSAVKRWAYPKSKHGTGGAIPRKHYAALSLASQGLGLPLTLADLAAPGEEDYGAHE